MDNRIALQPSRLFSFPSSFPPSLVLGVPEDHDGLLDRIGDNCLGRGLRGGGGREEGEEGREEGKNNSWMRRSSSCIPMKYAFGSILHLHPQPTPASFSTFYFQPRLSLLPSLPPSVLTMAKVPMRRV